MAGQHLGPSSERLARDAIDLSEGEMRREKRYQENESAGRRNHLRHYTFRYPERSCSRRSVSGAEEQVVLRNSIALPRRVSQRRGYTAYSGHVNSRIKRIPLSLKRACSPRPSTTPRVR